MTPEQRFDIVLYRLNSAKSLLDEIKDHIERGYYNTAMNRMYYACFYAVSGLLLQSEIDAESRVMKVYVKNSASILFLQVNSLKNGDAFILFCSIIVQLPIMKTLRTLI